MTTMPSPLKPSTLAVTTTSVSLATKFRMHLSFFPCLASRSNFRAEMEVSKRNMLQTYCSHVRVNAMLVMYVGGQSDVLCVVVFRTT